MCFADVCVCVCVCVASGSIPQPLRELFVSAHRGIVKTFSLVGADFRLGHKSLALAERVHHDSNISH
jgi:hypothetical protein